MNHYFYFLIFYHVFLILFGFFITILNICFFVFRTKKVIYYLRRNGYIVLAENLEILHEKWGAFPVQGGAKIDMDVWVKTWREIAMLKPKDIPLERHIRFLYTLKILRYILLVCIILSLVFICSFVIASILFF